MATKKAQFSPETFLTNVNRLGLAKSNRFEVHIWYPSSVATQVGISNENNILSLFCESTTLPGQSIGVKQQKIYGPNYQRPVSIDYGGEGITMSFLLDASMNIKSIFDIWISKIIDPIQYFVYPQYTYASQIAIMQLDEEDNVVYTIVLEDAFPRNVGQLELSHSSQNQVHKLPVTFAYRRWFPVHNLADQVTYPSLDLLYRKMDGRIQTTKKVQATMNALEKARNANGAENAVKNEELKRKLNR